MKKSCIEEKIKYWENMLDILDRCEIEKKDSLEIKVFKLYFKLENVAEVAKEINNMGYKIKTGYKDGRKYSSNDISEIIKLKNIADTELQKVVISMFKNHKKYIDRIHN